MTCWARAKGSLIIVSSTAAYHSTKGNPAYNASKTGAMGLTRTLGEAWAEDGIRVNGIAPGLVDTKMTKVTTANPKRLEGAIERIPLKRLGTPADMAGAALFLASPLVLLHRRPNPGGRWRADSLKRFRANLIALMRSAVRAKKTRQSANSKRRNRIAFHRLAR